MLGFKKKPLSVKAVEAKAKTKKYNEEMKHYKQLKIASQKKEQIRQEKKKIRDLETKKYKEVGFMLVKGIQKAAKNKKKSKDKSRFSDTPKGVFQQTYMK